MTLEGVAPVPGEPPDVPGYLVGQRLGAGASSEVWSAVALADRRRVALKVVAPTTGAEREDSVELAVLRGLCHPHVVRQHGDLELPDGRQVLVLELAGGGSLTRVVRARGHLTPGETVTVLTALARGLEELHRMGVTHADVAPGNVLLHLDGRPVLGDVGRSRIAGHRPAEVHGTTGFLDPAVLAGAEPGPASDVYGLGAVGWFCLTGQPPPPPVARLPGPDAGGQMPDVPADLAATLDRALAPDPEDRPSAAELARSLYRSCAAEPLRLAGDGDPVEELTHRIRRIALEAAAPTVARRRGLLSRLGVVDRLAGPARSSSRVRSVVGTALALLAVTATLAGSRAEPAAAGDRVPA